MTGSVVLDSAGRGRSPATMPGFHRGRPPRNKGDSSPFGGESGRVTRQSSQRRRPSLSSAGGTPELHARPGHDVHARDCAPEQVVCEDTPVACRVPASGVGGCLREGVARRPWMAGGMGMDEGAHLVSGLRGQQRRSIAGAFEVLPVRVTPKRRGEPNKGPPTTIRGGSTSGRRPLRELFLLQRETHPDERPLHAPAAPRAVSQLASACRGDLPQTTRRRKPAQQ